MRTLLAVAGPVLLAVAGCADGHFASRTTFSDSAGVRIATTDLRAAPLSPACRVDTAPRLQIGALDGPAEYQLGRVIDATRMPDGRIVVADRSNHEIRVFDATGKFVRTMGRTGDGPGEFRDPLQVTALGGDSLLVWDMSRHRAGARPLPRGELVVRGAEREREQTPTVAVAPVRRSGPAVGHR